MGGGPTVRWAVFLVALAVAIAFPYIRDWLPNSDYWLPMTTVLIIADFMLLALGLNIVVGYAGLLDLGYVAFWAIGAYCAGWFMSSFFVERDFHFLSAGAGDPARHPHQLLDRAAIIGGIACALAGIVIGAPTLRLRGDYLAIVTLGFGEIIPQVFLNLDEYTNGARGITPLDPIGLGFLHTISGGRIPEVGQHLRPQAALLHHPLLLPRVRSTCRCGCATASWAGPGSPSARTSWRPGAMGIPLMRTKLWAYAVGAFFGGVGGVFYAVDQSAVFPTSFFFNISILILCMVILGGMGNVWGVMLGAGCSPGSTTRGWPSSARPSTRRRAPASTCPNKSFLIFGIILVVMMLLRPEGLLPAARQKALIHEEIDETTGTAA